jgi:hypothetical protein
VLWPQLLLGAWPHHDDECDDRGGDDNECDGWRIGTTRVAHLRDAGSLATGNLSAASSSPDWQE